MPLKLAATAILAASSVGSLAYECADDVCTDDEAAMLQLKGKKTSFGWDNQFNFAKHFRKPLDYDGDLEVSGFAVVAKRTYPDSDGDIPVPLKGQILTWFLNGVDPACEHGPGPAFASCTVLISDNNDGNGCEDPVPWYNRGPIAVNPWTCPSYTSYHAFGGNRTSLSNLEVLTGYDDPVNQILIVRDYEGYAIGCSEIKPLLDFHHANSDEDDDEDHDDRTVEKRLMACVSAGKTAGVGHGDVDACMKQTVEDATGKLKGATRARGLNFHKQYCVDEWEEVTGYHGSLSPVPTVEGTVGITEAQKEAFWNPAIQGQRLSWTLEGLDPSCGSGPLPDAASAPEGTDCSSGPSCSIQIDFGTSCDEGPDRPLYNESLRRLDPWQCSTYTTNETAAATPQCDGSPVLTGVPMKDVKGHVVFIYDGEGYAYACGKIKEGACVKKHQWHK